MFRDLKSTAPDGPQVIASARMPLARLKIFALDPQRQERVVAHYNPKEVQFDKTIKWDDHKGSDGSFGLEYSGNGSARTFTIELLFDAAEQNESIRPHIDALHALTENVGSGVAEKRPPIVLVLWADPEKSIPSFPAVIESLSVKYQMFSSDGLATRATATIKLKEAGTVHKGKNDKKGIRY